MIISKIIINDCVHYNLHAEQSVTGAFIDEKGIGINEELLTIKTLDRISQDFEQHKHFHLILDFENLKSCQNNLKKKIIEIKSNTKVLVLTNISREIIEKLEVGIFNNPKNIKSEDGYQKFTVAEMDNIEINDVDIFNKKFVEYLKENSVANNSFDNYHESSSVYLTAYINVKGMIASNNPFFIYSIYKLALKIKKHWSELNDSDKPILICQNLNSSYITSILSSFLKLDILILDKLGPINKLYSTLDKKIEEGKKYLVVSDVVCLGTEVKIAKSIITFLGGRYLGNVSIIRIETLLSKSKQFNDTECVFAISKGNNPINYQITTALNNEIE